MKIIVSSVTCDYCETTRDFETDEEELEEGWLVVHQGEKALDFCDQACLASFYS